jgi:tRNA(fMet)-specific endonuclease VapC
MYLLDTDTLSNLMRRIAPRSLVLKMAAVPQDKQFTSSITLGEMAFGAYRRPERTQSLLRQIGEVLHSNLPILPFDEAAARRYGEVRAVLERRGTPIGDADIRIASIALTRTSSSSPAMYATSAGSQGLLSRTG